jgi:hypothetical protein
MVNNHFLENQEQLYIYKNLNIANERLCIFKNKNSELYCEGSHLEFLIGNKRLTREPNNHFLENQEQLYM